ncbi:hypothetical protein E0Y62_08800 [Cytobacillus praedii]|uniref:Uncharacterized protein n=2 Tax=Cytobacillus praedii TaxID=1742358 RepID=A0A4R1B210_9BACI|nr:hypothetical protein E0Y62_08800 [Cytobacillus praedii]
MKKFWCIECGNDYLAEVNRMIQTALITVTHDPHGRNVKLFQEFKELLEDVYSELFITVSEESSSNLLDALENSKFKTKIIPKLGAAHARREAVKFGLSGTSQFFHYCDFDRLITWVQKHSIELRKIVSFIPQFDYLILGRTERAFQTHPIEWQETERITNRICSIELGKEVDITAGSCAFSRKAGNYIKDCSKEKMTDAEWAMIVHRIANLEVNYLPVEGLEYQEDINSTNGRVTDSEAWLSRLKLSFIISETAYKVGK